MSSPPVFVGAAQTVLIITAGLLFYIGLTDLRTFRIRNEFVVILAALFFLHAFLSGRWVLLPWSFAFAAGMFVILLIAYARGALGGGDVKMLTVAFLWTGVQNAMMFAVFLLALSLLHIALAKLNWVKMPTKDGRPRIAYAPSIAGALILIFMLGYLGPISGQT